MNHVFRLTGSDPTKYDALMKCTYAEVFVTLCYLNERDEFDREYSNILRQQ